MSDVIRDTILSSMDVQIVNDPTSSNHTIETIQPNTRPVAGVGFPSQSINFSVQNPSSAQSFVYDLKNSYVNFDLHVEFTGTVTTSAGGISSEVKLSSGLLSRGCNVNGTHYSSPIEDIAFALNGSQLSSNSLNKNPSMYLLTNIINSAKDYNEYKSIISKASYGGINPIYIPEHREGDAGYNVNNGIEFNADRTKFRDSYTEQIIRNIPDAFVNVDITTSADYAYLATDAKIAGDISLSLPLNILINAFTKTQYITSYAMSKMDLTLKLNKSQSWDLNTNILSIKNIELVLSRYTLNSSLSNEIVERAMMGNNTILACTRSNFSSNSYALSAVGGSVGNGSISERIPGVYKPYNLMFFSHLKAYAAGLTDVEYVPITNPIKNLNSSTIGKYPIIYRDDINSSTRYNLYCECCGDRTPIPRNAFESLGLLCMLSPEVSPVDDNNYAVESGFILQLGYSTNPTIRPTTAANYINSVEIYTVANALIAYSFSSATPSMAATAPNIITRFVAISQDDYDNSIEECELKNDVIYYISK